MCIVRVSLLTGFAAVCTYVGDCMCGISCGGRRMRGITYVVATGCVQQKYCVAVCTLRICVCALACFPQVNAAKSTDGGKKKDDKAKKRK